MRVKSRISAVLVASALLLGASRAGAEPSLADRETARGLMDDGDKKLADGNVKGALDSYTKADALMSVPTTGLEVARTQVKLGLLLQARETLGKVLRLPVTPNEPAPFAAARKAAETLNSEIVGRVPSIQVVMTNGEPSQAPQVFVDGEEIPAPAVTAPRKVNPGLHIVTVKVGSSELKQDIDVLERDTKTVTFDLKELPPPTKPEGGGSSTSSKVLIFGGFGVAVIGIGVGTITGLMSLGQVSELEPFCKNNTCKPDKQDELDSAKGLGNISTAAFIVGGVGLGAGVLGLLTSGSSPKKDSPPPAEARARHPGSAFAPEHVRAVLGPSYVGITGAF